MDRVIIENGTATGVEGKLTQKKEKEKEQKEEEGKTTSSVITIKVNAKIVVSSAGSLHRYFIFLFYFNYNILKYQYTLYTIQNIIQNTIQNIIQNKIISPALLLRSGLKNRNIGRYLSLHPVAGVAGYFQSDDLKKFYTSKSV